MTETITREFSQGLCDGITDCLKGNRYYIGTEVSVGNADYLDGYSAGWWASEKIARAHTYTVRDIAGHGYPYRAVCPCGWNSTSYAAEHAAYTMGEDHVMAEALDAINSARRAQ